MIEISLKDIRLSAMNMLARREHSRQELFLKLKKKFPDHQVEIEQELEKLAQEGLQSDARLAEAFVRARTNKGQGPVKIRAELKGKGVSSDIISLTFEACDVDWFGLAGEVATKKFGDFGNELSDPRFKGKLSRFLQQRGFSFDHISSLC
jgi:regulatory protein